MAEPAMATDGIPEDVIFDILLTLPVTSLCRFRCISKAWRSLISDPRFIKTHLNRSKNKQERVLMVSESCDLLSVDLESSSQIGRRGSVEAVQLKFPPASELPIVPSPFLKKVKPSEYLCIMGSCDGLLLIRNFYCGMDRFVLNPSTREYRPLPDTPLVPNLECEEDLGLGYDSVHDDYKVVTICRRYADNYVDEFECAENIVSVFSLRSNSLRRIQDSPYDHSQGESTGGVFVRGALHWVADSTGTGDSSKKSTVIASLHLGDENFRSLPCPNSFDDLDLKENLFLVGGFLGVFVFNGGDCSADLWLMKKYGVRDSWTRFTISFRGWVSCKPLCSPTYGRALWAINQKNLVIFHKQPMERKVVQVQGCPAPIAIETYVESLVSPNCSDTIRNYQASHQNNSTG